MDLDSAKTLLEEALARAEEAELTDTLSEVLLLLVNEVKALKEV